MTRLPGRRIARVWLLSLIVPAVALTASPGFSEISPRQPRHHLQRAEFDPNHPSGPYLGQTPPGTTPKVFAPGFISLPASVEYSVAFSPDGGEIYFSRYTSTGNRDTTWMTRQIDGAWITPAVAAFATGTRDTEPFITADGSRMYFVSIRSGGPQTTQIWTMERASTGWSTPVRLTSPFSTRPKMYPTATASGALYFTEELSATRRQFVVARSVGAGFETPVPLSATINAYNAMGHVFVAPDESFLVFDADPNIGRYVLHVAFKGSDASWLPPVRFDDAINGTGNATCPTMSPDGRYLFFQRGGDLYWVDAKVVNDLRPADASR